MKNETITTTVKRRWFAQKADINVRFDDDDDGLAFFEATWRHDDPDISPSLIGRVRVELCSDGLWWAMGDTSGHRSAALAAVSWLHAFCAGQ